MRDFDSLRPGSNPGTRITKGKQMKEIKKCESGKKCGWTDDGHYVCHCNIKLPTMLDNLREEIASLRVLTNVYDGDRNYFIERIRLSTDKMLKILNEK